VKYILAFLILIGGLIGVIAFIVLYLFFCDKVKEREWDFSWKHKRYRKFKENILPWICVAIIGVVFLFCLGCVYFEILEYF